jgi:large subunit ribosomal protein L10
LKGGEFSLAFSKQHKETMLKEYGQWLKKSQAVFVIEYARLNMKDIDTLRAKVRESGGEAHVVKNTLMDLALKNTGVDAVKGLAGTCLFGFAFNDIPALAKVYADATKNSDILKLKGGFLNGRPITAEQVKALADLPPLPVMRARLLGTILAPASQLARVLAEPGRGVAAAIRAYTEKETAPAAA